MSRVRRTRGLSADERQLWAQVLRGVTPFRGRILPEPAQPPAVPATAPDGVKASVTDPSARPAPQATLPPLAPLERTLRTGLRRGKRGVDAAIDLHGLRQDEAHGALLAFLRRSQAAGHALVLVVTGKGAPSAEGGWSEERGVLRRVVPHWLRLPDLRPLVLGFEEAAPQHGGSGALYIRLRRRRPHP